MSTRASPITSLTQPFVQVQTKKKPHQSSASLALVRGNHRWSVNAPHKWPVTRKMFPIDDVIMTYVCIGVTSASWRLKSPTTGLFAQQFVGCKQRKRQCSVLLIVCEGKNHWWIPLTKAQQCAKHVNILSTSCHVFFCSVIIPHLDTNWWRQPPGGLLISRLRL